MNTPIKTNKLVYKLNYNEIDKKFDIFAVKTSKKYFEYGAYILDVPAMDRNVKSVHFEGGKCFHVLMEKNYENKYLLRQAIDKAPDFDTIFFSQISSCDMEDYALLQLFLNSLGSASHKLLSFNNLTGSFYCFHPEWLNKKNNMIWQVSCLDIKITPEYKMKFDVKTFSSEKLRNKINFTSRKFEDYPKYIISTVHNTLKRKTSGDKGEVYIPRQVEGQKKSIEFIDVYQLDKFNTTKMGVVSKIIEKFNEKFKGLAEIDFECISEYISLDYDNKKAKENKILIESELKNRNICRWLPLF